MYTHNWAQGESAIIRAPQRGVEATVGTPFSQGGKHAQAEPIDNAEAAPHVNLHGQTAASLVSTLLPKISMRRCLRAAFPRVVRKNRTWTKKEERSAEG